MKPLICVTVAVLVFTLLASCLPPAPFEEATAVPTPTRQLPTPERTITETPTVASIDAVSTISVSIDTGSPQVLVDWIDQLIQVYPEQFQLADSEYSTVHVGMSPDLQLGDWVYVAITQFSNLTDQVMFSDISSAWVGQATGVLEGWQVVLTEDAVLTLQHVFSGPPADHSIVEPHTISKHLWQHTNSWSIVPFETLEPRLKVLHVDGLSPLDKPIDSAYPLTVPIGLRGTDEDISKVHSALRTLPGFPQRLTNRDEEKLTVLAMTGVTALVRATAYQMEAYGINFPGEIVSKTLSSADITHISNEIAFSPDCPFPDPAVQEEGPLRFCSRDDYIELLELIGTDIVELTGNHLNDWGHDALLHTLDLYQQRNWSWFGGGANSQEGLKPLIVSAQGNDIAFIGCNIPGPHKAWATESSPGAAPCTIESISEVISATRPLVDVIVAGIQYYEFYTYTATSQHQLDFQALIDAGAVIVNGSQGHHVQGFSLPEEGGFIHYGVGNLFFDQMDQIGTRQTFIDRHVIYQGRHISTELWTGIIEAWAQPRSTTPSERQELLRAVFEVSNW
ncbi:MAG: CapA family protein [Chloroflexota bacterium]